MSLHGKALLALCCATMSGAWGQPSNTIADDDKLNDLCYGSPSDAIMVSGIHMVGNDQNGDGDEKLLHEMLCVCAEFSEFDIDTPSEELVGTEVLCWMESRASWRLQWQTWTMVQPVIVFGRMKDVVDYDHLQSRLAVPARKYLRVRGLSPSRKHRVLHDPISQGDCFFLTLGKGLRRCRLISASDADDASWIRHEIGEQYLKRELNQLRRAARQEGCSVAAYLRALKQNLLGGMPEAQCAASRWQCRVVAERPNGQVIYDFGERDAKHIIRLGFARKHYVALECMRKDAPWVEKIFENMAGTVAFRGGGRRSQSRRGARSGDVRLRSRSRRTRPSRVCDQSHGSNGKEGESWA